MKKSKPIGSMAMIRYSPIFTGYEFWDAPGICQRVDHIFGTEFAMASAMLRSKVNWTELRSIRSTYCATRVPRTTFTKKLQVRAEGKQTAIAIHHY